MEEVKKIFKKHMPQSLWQWIVGLSLCIILFVLGIILGATVFSPEPDEDSINTGNIGEISILPDTMVRTITHYKCGHIKVSDTDRYTGYTESMLRELDNCTVDEMTSDFTCLIFNSDEYCTNHFLLMTVDSDILCVFSTDADGHGKEQLMEIHFDISTLHPDEQESLRHGILFDSLEAINIYLENMET